MLFEMSALVRNFGQKIRGGHVRVNGLSQVFCETRFRFASVMTPLCCRCVRPAFRSLPPRSPCRPLPYHSGVASGIAFPQLINRFPAVVREGNRKPVDHGERPGNS